MTLHFQEFCSLGSLRSALDKGTLGSRSDGDDEVGSNLEYFRTVAHIAAQAASGLAYAHSCGVLHCDVKSENVLLQRVDSEQRFEGAVIVGCRCGMDRCASMLACASMWPRVIASAAPRGGRCIR